MRQRMKVGKISCGEHGWTVEVNAVDERDERTYQGYAVLYMTKEEATALEIGDVLTWEMMLAANKVAA